MADLRKYIQAQPFTLSVGISTTDTSITLQSFNLSDGTAIASGDLGSINYGTLEAGTSREEQISFTGITTNGDGTVTLTGVTRGLGFGAADTYSEQSDLKKQHGAGSSFILSNTPAFYDGFVNKYNDETISGTLTVPTPTSAGHAVTKAYADALVVGGLNQDKVVVAGNAGESVAAGDLVYFDDTDNEWKKTDADTAATVEGVLLGIAQGSGSDGVAITDGILLSGVDANQSGLTVGVRLYVGNTAGAIAESAGTTERVIGFIIKLSELDATEPVIVGTGGAAVSVSSETGTNGNAGGASYFKNSSIQAGGGAGGAGSTGSGTASTAAGGTPSGAIDASESGGGGGGATSSSPSASSGGSTTISGPGGGGSFQKDVSPTSGTGAGGTTLLGIGGSGGAGVSGSSSNDGGVGAGGGGSTAKSGTVTSGAGGDGFVRVTVF